MKEPKQALFKSINPYNGKEIASYTEQTEEEVIGILEKSQEAFGTWPKVSIPERETLLRKAANLLRKNVDKYARTMTLEMGKPIGESRAEIIKCAWVCEFYAENAARFLADEIIESDAAESFVSHDPIGPVLAIMPWNFPFWQVFRFAAPTLMAGNTALLKHAPNVFGCATHIEELLREAGFPDGVFQNLMVHHDRTEEIIAGDIVRAVTLTGSERAGRAVGSLAGKYLKKSVLELGGNNAFIVWEDADMKQAVQTGVRARMLNSGQSCIAAKRFIVVGKAYDKFVPDFLEQIASLKDGDPLDESTEMGPLAREDLAEQLQEQVNKSLARGAELLTGGGRRGAFHEPTVLTNVQPGMPAFDEETFGPLAAIIKAKDKEEAFELASLSRYGLGTTLFTKDIEEARKSISKIPDGAFFINELVKSDPRLPFGGTKHSGYGRELSRDGILEFVNKKTVYVNT
ncbi:NAD-dependent succinate-semialdehyde dehydrogenase [Balneolaceae bacterium YR4-1]|uniref:NAD-dependent succinate-semialdehyde dehydrogenase n=1 Tax=Halalkalibaculum roseum TaxID=2709311 RepID=A0A6M1SS61_9BACT|nr:NAD-dependent succinate-semialdehyde dehydrogenase [Halalkalibaculum roseum]NGP75670.1 NAD-dependent succinate-semialdehyde dehydrogenase [Halalkalibaculum roseum]